MPQTHRRDRSSDEATPRRVLCQSPSRPRRALEYALALPRRSSRAASASPRILRSIRLPLCSWSHSVGAFAHRISDPLRVVVAPDDAWGDENEQFGLNGSAAVAAEHAAQEWDT